MLVFEEDGKFSQIRGSPWGPPVPQQCLAEEPSLREIAPHPATGDPSGHPNVEGY